MLRALLWKVPGLAFPFGLSSRSPSSASASRAGAPRSWPRRSSCWGSPSSRSSSRRAIARLWSRCSRCSPPPGVRWAVVEASPRARVGGGPRSAVYPLANVGQGRCRSRMNPTPSRAWPTGSRARAGAGGPRAVRAPRPRGADLVRRLVRGRPAGDRARPARQGGGGSRADPRAPSRSSRTPRSSWRGLRLAAGLRARGGGLRRPRDGPRRRQRPGPAAHGGGARAASRSGPAPPAAVPTGSSSSPLTLAS